MESLEDEDDGREGSWTAVSKILVMVSRESMQTGQKKSWDVKTLKKATREASRGREHFEQNENPHKEQLVWGLGFVPLEGEGGCEIEDNKDDDEDEEDEGGPAKKEVWQ